MMKHSVAVPLSAILAILAVAFLAWRSGLLAGRGAQPPLGADFGSQTPEAQAEYQAFYTPWPIPDDLVRLSADNVDTMLAIISSHVEAKASQAALTSAQQQHLGPAVASMMHRIVHGLDMESTLRELGSLGVIVMPDTREVLLPYFDKGRSMTVMPKLSPGSVHVRKVFENGVELPAPFLGASSMNGSPMWSGMLPMGDDPITDRFMVVEARVSVWTPILPDGPSELQHWGMQLAWDERGSRWIPRQLVKYTKIDRPNTPKSIAISPM